MANFSSLLLVRLDEQKLILTELNVSIISFKLGMYCVLVTTSFSTQSHKNHLCYLFFFGLHNFYFFNWSIIAIKCCASFC